MRNHGDSGTARKQFENHHLSVFRFLRRMTGSVDEAEDLLQETFLRVARAQQRYREQGNERAWLFRIARNVLLNRRRDRGRRPREHEGTESLQRGPQVLERLGLQEALEKLDVGLREAFLLREVGGLGYMEIAAACDTTPDAVRNRIFRARMELRRVLSKSSGRGGRLVRMERSS